MIDRLMEQMKPAIDGFRKDPATNPNYRTMMRVRDRILAEDGKSPIFATNPVINAGRCALAMQVDVNDHDDVEKAAEFLFMGFTMMVTLVKELCGTVDTETLVKMSGQLEIRC